MTETNVVSFRQFKDGTNGDGVEAPPDATNTPKNRSVALKAFWYASVESIRFGSLAGAAWMLFSHPMALWQYGDWVWLLSWIAYPVFGGALIRHAADFGFHSFLLNCLYFVAGVVLLFHETWLGVVVLLPHAVLFWPSSSERVYVMRPF